VVQAGRAVERQERRLLLRVALQRPIKVSRVVTVSTLLLLVAVVAVALALPVRTLRQVLQQERAASEFSRVLTGLRRSVAVVAVALQQQKRRSGAQVAAVTPRELLLPRQVPPTLAVAVEQEGSTAHIVQAVTAAQAS